MFSLYPNTIANPVAYSNEGMELTVYEKLNYASLHQGEYEELKKDSVELYPFLRDIYEQRRDKLIKE
jgi:phospholipid-binding lipoprotein MlaA